METNDLAKVYASKAKAVQATLMRNVYTWMTLALVITGLVSLYVAKSYTLLSMIIENRMLFWGLLIAEIGLVIYLSARIHRIAFSTATLLFIAYSILNGVTLAFIFMIYTMSSIATTFFVTAGTFGVMALYGYVTKKDLSRIGNICIMALIGLIIASLVNLIFTGLTAYDSQKIKQLLTGEDIAINDTTQKIALMGAMTLYLDFINLFLYLLRFLGDRK